MLTTRQRKAAAPILLAVASVFRPQDSLAQDSTGSPAQPAKPANSEPAENQLRGPVFRDNPLSELKAPALFKTPEEPLEPREPTKQGNSKKAQDLLLQIAPSVLGLASMVWYLSLLKRGKTEGSLPSAMIYTLNNLVFFGESISTPEKDWSQPILFMVYAGFSAFTAHYLVKRNKANSENKTQPLLNRFSNMEKLCLGLSVVGLVPIPVSHMETFQNVISQPTMNSIVTATGIIVNILATVPLIAELLKKPKEAQVEEACQRLSTKDRRIQMANAVGPFLLGLTSYVATIAVEQQKSFQTLLSPVALLTVSLLLTVASGVRAARTYREKLSPES